MSFLLILKNGAARLAGTGINSRLPENEKRYIVLINVIAIFFIVFVWSYVPLVPVFMPDNMTLMWILAFHGIFFIAIPVLNHFGRYLSARVAFGIFSLIFMCLESLFTGPETYTHFFLIIAPIVVFLIYPERERIIQNTIALLISLSFFLLNAWYLSHDAYYQIKDPVILLFLQWTVKSGLVLCILAISIYANYIITRTEALLYIEYRKADALLRNILPDKIAERLKKSHTTIADRFSKVSVLFADIVNFTRLSESTPPESLVMLLDEIFPASMIASMNMVLKK